MNIIVECKARHTLKSNPSRPLIVLASWKEWILISFNILLNSSLTMLRNSPFGRRLCKRLLFEPIGATVAILVNMIPQSVISEPRCGVPKKMTADVAVYIFIFCTFRSCALRER